MVAFLVQFFLRHVRVFSSLLISRHIFRIVETRIVEVCFDGGRKVAIRAFKELLRSNGTAIAAKSFELLLELCNLVISYH